MEKPINLLVMGGDRRYLETMEQLASKGVYVIVVGFDQLSLSIPNVIQDKLENVELEQIDGILIPLNGTDPNGEIEAVYSESSIRLTLEMLKRTPEHCAVYTGISTDYLDKIAQDANREIVRLTDRGDMAILNSIPTAEGVLHLAIEETEHTIHGSKVTVLGYGRTGMTISRLFSAVGAHVTVAARKESDLARVKEMGMRPLHMDQLADHMNEVDICINTVPYHVLNADVLSKMSPSALIIDIVSKPGGTDFQFAKEKGIKAVHALGLPGKTAPKTGGEIVSTVLFKLLAKS